jgi:hypothetical protein
MENLKKLIENLDELVNKVIGEYKLYEPIYGYFECEIRNNGTFCKFPDYVGIKRREDIIKAMIDLCYHIATNNRGCVVRISNYSETSEITRRKIEFTLDEMNRFNIVKYYKPYRIYIGDLRTIKGLIQISVYISY